MNYIPLIIAFVFMALGLFAIIIPGLPDTFLIFLGALIYAIWTKFFEVNLNLILILAGLMVFGYFLDYLGAALGAKKFGASKLGVLGAILGGFLGLILLSLPGLAIGAIFGTVVFELIFAQKDFQAALKSGVGTFLGLLFGILAKIIIIVLMIGLFVRAVF